MRLGQTGKFYTATVFLFLLIASIFAIIFPIQGPLADIYSVLYSQLALFLALAVGVTVLGFSRKRQGLKPLYIPFIHKKTGRHDLFAYLLIPPLSLVIVFGFNDINEVVLYLFSLIGIKGSVINPFWTTPGYLALALFLLAVLPAVLEEIFIRGYCLDGMSGLKNWEAVLISALLFSVMHMNPAQTVYQFLLGVILALLVKIGGKITYAILLHFCNNAIVVLTTYFSGPVDNPVFNTSYILWSLAYALAGVIGILTILFIFAYIFKRRSSHPTTLRFLISALNSDNGDVTAATKVEKMLFWGFFAITLVVWVGNTIVLSLGK